MKTNYNMYEMSNLNDEQIRNVKSAYKAKESGIISEKQYLNNLQKNNVNIDSYRQILSTKSKESSLLPKSLSKNQNVENNKEGNNEILAKNDSSDKKIK